MVGGASIQVGTEEAMGQDFGLPGSFSKGNLPWLPIFSSLSLVLGTCHSTLTRGKED